MIVCRKNTSILALWNFTPLVSIFTIFVSYVPLQYTVVEVSSKYIQRNERARVKKIILFLILPYVWKTKRGKQNPFPFRYQFFYYATPLTSSKYYITTTQVVVVLHLYRLYRYYWYWYITGTTDHAWCIDIKNMHNHVEVGCVMHSMRTFSRAYVLL